MYLIRISSELFFSSGEAGSVSAVSKNRGSYIFSKTAGLSLLPADRLQEMLLGFSGAVYYLNKAEKNFGFHKAIPFVVPFYFPAPRQALK